MNLLQPIVFFKNYPRCVEITVLNNYLECISTIFQLMKTGKVE